MPDPTSIWPSKVANNCRNGCYQVRMHAALHLLPVHRSRFGGDCAVRRHGSRAGPIAPPSQVEVRSDGPATGPPDHDPSSAGGGSGARIPTEFGVPMVRFSPLRLNRPNASRRRGRGPPSSSRHVQDREGAHDARRADPHVPSVRGSTEGFSIRGTDGDLRPARPESEVAEPGEWTRLIPA